MARKAPAVEAAFPICKELNCLIAAWGKDSLVVEIKDNGRFESLKIRLAAIGFHFHPDEDSQGAGLYDFSLSVESAQSKRPNQFEGQQVIRLPFGARYQHLFLFLLCAGLVVGDHHQWLDFKRLFLLGASLVLLVYSIRNILWRVEFLEGGFNVHSLFSKKFAAWSDITSIESKSYNRGFDYVVLKLRSKKTINTPIMSFIRAGDMRDEIKRKFKEEKATKLLA